MKKILLLGRLGINIPNFQTGVTTKEIQLFSGTSLEDVKNVFEQNDDQIEMVIMGAGIPLEKRLKIIEYVFTVSKNTTVHMKDWNSGPQGMLPFVNGVLGGLVG
jgi:hypothetical protein